MKLIFFLYGIFFHAGLVLAQIEISGIVRSIENKSPLANVNVSVQGSYYGTATNQNGDFILKNQQLPVTIKISHIAFETKIIVLTENPKPDFVIYLNPATKQLEPFVCRPNRVENIVKDQSVFITDYAFYQDGIILIAYKNRNINQQNLLYLTSAGDSIHSRTVYKTVMLIRDFQNYILLLTKNDAYTIEADSQKIWLNDPYPVDDFYNIIRYFVTLKGDKLIWQQLRQNRQELLYFNFDVNKRQNEELYIVSNQQGINMLDDKARILHNATAADIRFEELMMYPPVFAPMFCLGDSLVVFNFLDSKIEIINFMGEILRSVPISFNYDKNCKEEIIVDESNLKFYSVFNKQGITTLNEINLETGNLGKKILIPEFEFVEKIKIKNDIVYFLFKENDKDEFKHLYKMKI